MRHWLIGFLDYFSLKWYTMLCIYIMWSLVDLSPGCCLIVCLFARLFVWFRIEVYSKIRNSLLAILNVDVQTFFFLFSMRFTLLKNSSFSKQQNGIKFNRQPSGREINFKTCQILPCDTEPLNIINKIKIPC